ncbi:MAG TPA: glutamate racemase, partial [Candidatus Omnitrophota bacterium]|nr:glutamate racemase [Candidatus Omnitrophota bacterium]
RPIGVFDSGVGGLTVVRGIRENLPGEDIIYFGDTARVPYGNKSSATIKRFSREIINFLLEKNVKLIVAACNTASSLAIPGFQKQYIVPVIGVIRSGAEEAAAATKNKRIGVIGTTSTIASGAYEKELRRTDPSCKLFSKSCPLFVPLVENGMFNDKVTFEMASRYLEYFKNKNIDTLILGCTHYPLLKTTIQKIMKNVTLIDSGYSVARTVAELLAVLELRSIKPAGRSYLKCYVSDDAKGFDKIAHVFLKEKITAKKAVL